jgi:Asp-tRNA(Asn)/Glu-tRNA(Gln) amidotransferase A subunit family amidase
MMNVIAGHDEKDSTSVSESVAPVCNYLEKLDEPIRRLKIGTVPELNAGSDQWGN